MPDAGEQHKILIVDDQAENIRILMETLKAEYGLVAARDGAKALSIAHREPMPDMVLLDVMMPDMDGYEVCAALKADPTTREIPVIFITALSEAADEAKGLGLGAVDYIAKPINPDLVRARVRNHLELKRSRDFLRRVFGQFVSSEVRDKIITEKNQLLGERKEIAVLFADIRQFTTHSERAAPDEIVLRLNAYFDRMVRCITREAGTVDKFIGDAVMATFGGLIEIESPCDAALRAAVAMRTELQELNRVWAAEGTDSFENGIGLHFGEVLQGTIGSSDRKEFTIIGDTVNITARLESLTKGYDEKVLCSAAFAGRLSADLASQLVDLGSVPVRGRDAEVGIFGHPGDA